MMVVNKNTFVDDGVFGTACLILDVLLRKKKSTIYCTYWDESNRLTVMIFFRIH